MLSAYLSDIIGKHYKAPMSTTTYLSSVKQVIRPCPIT